MRCIAVAVVVAAAVAAPAAQDWQIQETTDPWTILAESRWPSNP